MGSGKRGRGMQRVDRAESMGTSDSDHSSERLPSGTGEVRDAGIG